MSRKHLTVDGKIHALIEKECNERNKARKLGDRKSTKQSITEEAIIFWHKERK